MLSFSWSDLVFGSMASEITGSGKSIDSRTIDFFVAQCVASGHALQADRGRDVARVDFFHLACSRALQKLADALGALLGGVQHAATRSVDAE